MKKQLLACAVALFMTGAASGQMMVTINFDPAAGSANLAAATGVHIHSGGAVDTLSAWSYVIGEWGNPASAGGMTQEAGMWKITMDPNAYYGAATNGPVPTGENILRIGMVFRESGPCGGFGGASNNCGEQKDDANSDIFVNLATSPPSSSWSGVTVSLATATQTLNKTKLIVSAYPNPFAGNLNVSYQVADVARDVNVKVYNMIGQEVAQIVNEKQEPGLHTVSFDGSELAEGTYFVRFSIDNEIATQKVVLNR